MSNEPIPYDLGLALWSLLSFVLVAVAVGTILAVVLQGSGRSLGQMTRRLIVGGLWSVPVLVVLGLVVARAVPQLQADQSLFAPQRMAVVDGVLTWKGRPVSSATVMLYAARGRGLEPAAVTRTDHLGRFTVRLPFYRNDQSVSGLLAWTQNGRPLPEADVRFQTAPEAEIAYQREGHSVTFQYWMRNVPPAESFPPFSVDEVSADDTATASLPPEVRQWLPAKSGAGVRQRAVIVSSSEHPTIWDAQKDAEQRAREIILADARGNAPTAWAEEISAELLNAAIQKRHHETIEHETDRHKFVMHRVHFLVSVTDEVQHGLHQAWVEAVRTERLWTLGGLTGMAVLIVGTAATYLRLDRATRGAHRTKLKLASVSFLTAAGLTIAGLLPLA